MCINPCSDLDKSIGNCTCHNISWARKNDMRGCELSNVPAAKVERSEIERKRLRRWWHKQRMIDKDGKYTLHLRKKKK
jgi:hypothetical protein